MNRIKKGLRSMLLGLVIVMLMSCGQQSALALCSGSDAAPNAAELVEEYRDLELAKGMVFTEPRVAGGRVYARVFVERLQAGFPISANYSISVGEKISVTLSGLRCGGLELKPWMLSAAARLAELPEYVAIDGDTVTVSLPPHHA